jgi:hypothetical protein
MTVHFSDAVFHADGADLRINGVLASVDTKLSLLCESLCVVGGDRALVDQLNCTPTPDDDEVCACAEPRLVELAARWWLWANSDRDSYDPEPQQIFPDDESARAALAKHLEQLWAIS